MKKFSFLFLFIVFSLMSKEVKVYELIIDFGKDFAFSHEVTKDKAHCIFRAKIIEIKEENAKAYCVERKYGK